jgi:hypothetical protein
MNFISWIKRNWYKILTIAVLLGALGSHPYAYYQILRWIVSIAAAFSAIQFHENERQGWMWVFIVIAILFNPIAPIYMNKTSWQPLDLMGAFVFCSALFVGKKKHKTHGD